MSDFNYIVEYYEKIMSGEIIACSKIKQVYQKVVDDLKNNEQDSEWYYDNSKAEHVITFIERFCKHSKGSFAGKPVILELWQKAFLSVIFGFVDSNGNRKYREALLIIGRKNGKSTLASALGLYMLLADGEEGAEVYSCATKKEQAKLLWIESKRMIESSPVLSKKCKCLVSQINCKSNNGLFKPLASDSNSLDGLNVSCALLDEIHAWKTSSLYDVIVDGMSARLNPLTLLITTAGTVRESIYDSKYGEAEAILKGYNDPDGYKDDRFIPFVYELDDSEEYKDESCWVKANPALGTIKQVDNLRTKVNKAINNPSLVKNLLCKDFNIRQTSSSAWLTFEMLNNEETFDITALKPRYAIGGVDLSATTDLSSACIIFKVPNDERLYVESMSWLPEDLLEKRIKDDKIPYDIWIDRGLMRTCKGNKINYSDITNWFVEISQKYDVLISWIGYDSWNSQYWIDEMINTFGKNTMVVVRQGKKTFSQPMKSLQADLENGLIVYNNNPLIKWALSNVAIDIDVNENIQPVKYDARKRIDPFMSLLDAYVVYQNNKLEYDYIV